MQEKKALRSRLSWEDPLEKGMATHSSILAWRIPWTEEPGRLQSIGFQDTSCLLGERRNKPGIEKMCGWAVAVNHLGVKTPLAEVVELGPTSQNIGNKSKNTQMGPN